MDTLVQIYADYTNNDSYIYNHHSAAAPLIQTEYNSDSSRTGQYQMNDHETYPPPTSSSSSGEVSVKPDRYYAVLKFMNDMLMEEEDLQDKPCMLNECLALQVQAAEKSLYDVLVNKQPPSADDQCCPSDVYTSDGYESPPGSSEDCNSNSNSSSNGSTAVAVVFNNSSYYHEGTATEFLDGNNSYSRKRSPSQEEERNSKHLATISELESESDQTDSYDEDLLLSSHFQSTTTYVRKSASRKGRPRGKRTMSTDEVVVDLRNLLTQCAQTITNNDLGSAYELLRKIKQHSSPYGDSTQRLAHYFANAIEARLAGTGPELYGAHYYHLRKISAAQILRAYHSHMMACPFHRMSIILANGSIRKLAEGKKKLHIIDIGILYGFQWPCFIEKLSQRPGGPPKLRITGIDLPQPGFRPAERVEDTGRRLAKYCKRFNVPFEYFGIAKKWDEIRIEELRIEKDELTVVNCMYRSRNMHDETVVESSPRDAVLRLIRRINPDVFVHGILNGTHNAPFLLSRFREALFHYSTLFDMFDATTERESKDRLLFEQEVYGRDVMNVIACEGTSRIERPETYKQWQTRNIRAGFRQLPLYREKVEEVKNKVRLNYHKDFLVDEDGHWMLQGWKGRVLFALSLWKPA